MSQSIILKQNPKIEFQLLDHGFQLIDEQTDRNSGVYSYNDLEHVELNKTWFPRLAKSLRKFTWMVNGAPFFPDAETCKKATVIIHLRQSKLGIWLTDSSMTDKARILKDILDEKSKLERN